MSQEAFFIYPPVESPFQACTVIRALGFAEVVWPSGRRTLEQYAANVCMSDFEAANSSVPHELLAAMKLRNLEQTMREFQRQAFQHGYWIRAKRHRRKPRAVSSVTWIHPNEYHGSQPGRGNVLDA